MCRPRKNEKYLWNMRKEKQEKCLFVIIVVIDTKIMNLNLYNNLVTKKQEKETIWQKRNRKLILLQEAKKIKLIKANKTNPNV